ncbi:MAG: hypothetical protein U5K70_09380 [Halodesulfurarchaeum sp.]|nr:hypothetical protein [Halodesulfurarchaeum sp.]
MKTLKPLADGYSSGGLVSEELTDLMYVGSATEAVLESAGVEPADIEKRRVSHAQLVKTGVNPGVAAKIRREHSLSWSLEGGEDLDLRAHQVRGLQDAERKWVAASAAGWDDETPETDRPKTSTDKPNSWERQPWPNQPGGETDFEAEAEWRERSAPKPISTLEGVDAEAEAALAEAGIISVRRLATCNPTAVAASLDVEKGTVEAWRSAARAEE